MIPYNANGSRLSPMIGRLAIGRAQRLHTDAASFVMNAAQVAALLELSIPAEPATYEDLVAAYLATADRDVTFCGLPVIRDPNMPKDAIELREKTGSVIARIVNLAVPDAGK